MSGLIRRLLKVIFLLGSLALLCLGGFYYVTRTESGLKSSWMIAKRFIPGDISLNQLQGSIHRTISFDHFQYAIDGTKITIEKGDIDANFWALLTKHIVINHVNAEDVIIDIPPPSDKPNNVSFNDIINVLSAIHINQASVNNLRIIRENKILFSTNTITIQPDESHLSMIDAELPNGHLSLVVQQNPWNVKWQLDIPQINLMIPSISGSLTSSGQFRYDNASPVVTASFNAYHIGTADYQIERIIGEINNRMNNPQFLDGNLQLQAIHLNNVVIPMISASIKSEWKNSDWLSQSDIVIDKTSSAKATFNISRGLTVHEPFRIQGSLTAHANNLTPINQFIEQSPQLKFIRGVLNANISITGTLRHPVISGYAALNDGSLRIPTFNTQISNLQLQANYQASQLIKLSGGFNAGTGKAAIDGTVRIKDNAIELESTVKGDELQAANTSEYKILASPNIKISYIHNNLTIDGNITIPSAEITPTDFSTTVSLPSDVVIVNQQTSVKLPPKIGLSIQLTLGERIKIKYQNLTSKVTGSLHITQRPGTEARAIGELYTTEGTYKGYGHILTIQSGKLIYTGNVLTNPGIDVRAVKTIRTVGYSEQSQFNSNDFQPVYAGTNTMTVGLWIHGTIKKPIITMFSEPPGLSQGDILSYIVFGYPQSQASGASGLALLNMASNSNGSDAKNVSDKVQNILGLNELSVGSTEYYDTTSNSTQNATTVNVGRNLGHNLSLHYNIGVFTPVSIFSLRYQLSRHFAIQSETSALENGGDLLYQVEGGN